MGDRGRAAVFVDRDGTLIRDVGYLCRAEQLEILPNVPEAIRLLQEKDYKVVVVTNQSAVARGRLTEAMLADIHGELLARLARRGARLDAVYYCPHHPTEGFAPYKMVCDCRKPNTAMIRRAETELKLDPSRSYIVGDQMTDMELAARSASKGIWINHPNEMPVEIASAVVHVAPNLWEAARWIAGAD